MINNGALPPDLSLMAKARHQGTDYIFHLLTGYSPSPYGVKLRDGLNYNPYFAGGAIGMAPPLSDGGVEFEDGTPATVSQQAKDVATFLNWCAEPEHDARKKAGAQWLLAVGVAFLGGWYHRRFVWSIYKFRKITYKDNPFKKHH